MHSETISTLQFDISQKHRMSRVEAIQNLAPKPSSRLQAPADSHSSLTLVCSACQAGPFSRKGFEQAFYKEKGKYDTGYCYTTTWGTISRSISNEGCNWCRIIRRTRDGLPLEMFPPNKENVEVIFYQEEWWDNNLNADVKGLGIRLNGYRASRYKIYAKSLDGSAINGVDAGATVTHRKKSYADYDEALRCITRCSSDHESCPIIEETYLPIRVIDCSNPSNPRLVETHRQIQGHYCTLSYVWGGEQPQKTTTSNVDTYVREGINIPLPQTIVDAIFVTNKLGVRYLWVDAMCIIQDSTEDKDRELRVMAQIYRNAYVTISASSAYRADHGFLPDKRPLDVLPFFGDRWSVLPDHMLVGEDIEFDSGQISEWPFDRRGWCLQETVLSPRKLIFHAPFLSYECRSFRMNLGKSNQNPEPKKEHILFPTNKGYGSRTTAGDQELLQEWQKVIVDYTKRKITVPSDKLVALASIAEVFQSALNDEYIAGLWRRSLLDGLLWEVGRRSWNQKDDVLLPRPLCYRAPTWSWASVDGHLKYSFPPPPSFSTSYKADILACEVTPRNSAFPLGEVADGRLTMKVKMRPLMLDRRTCSSIEWYRHREGDWIPPAEYSLSSESMYVTFDSLEGTEQGYQMDFDVIILRAGTNKEIASLTYWIEGLIVLPVEGKVDQYRRVAKLNIRRALKWPNWFDAMPLKTVTLV